MSLQEDSPAGRRHCLAGEPDGQVRDHLRWLRSVIWARLREPEAVEEVLQEVLLAYARHRPEQHNGQLAPWLYRVAVRQCLLYRRRQARWQRRQRQAQVQRTRTQPQQERGLDPLQWLLAQERRQLVRQALEQLPPRDAQVLLMKYADGLSYQQIAARLGVSQASVESRLHRARAKMRKLLARLLPEPSQG